MCIFTCASKHCDGPVALANFRIRTPILYDVTTSSRTLRNLGSLPITSHYTSQGQYQGGDVPQNLLQSSDSRLSVRRSTYSSRMPKPKEFLKEIKGRKKRAEPVCLPPNLAFGPRRTDSSYRYWTLLKTIKPASCNSSLSTLPD